MTPQETTNKRSNAAVGKYLTFTLGRESYGIPVLKVREIIKLVPITAVPQMPGFIKGVINLRGKIIPVMDMRIRFCLSETASDEHCCIIVVQIAKGNGTQLQMGLMVDAVEEVINIAASDIEDTPDFGTAVDTDYILGMAKIKGVVKALLDIDRILGSSSVQTISENIPG